MRSIYNYRFSPFFITESMHEKQSQTSVFAYDKSRNGITPFHNQSTIRKPYNGNAFQ